MLSGEGPVLKIAAMHPPTIDFPATLAQEHPDPKNTVTMFTAKKEGRA